MVKYRIEGPDAEAFLRPLTLRDVAQAEARAACTTPPGATTRALCSTTARCSGWRRPASACAARSGICPGCSTAPSASTSTIEEETEAVAGLALQGPTSFAVLRDAGFAGVEKLKVFDLAEFAHDGGTVTHLAHRLHRRSRLRAVRAGRQGAEPVGPADDGGRSCAASGPSATPRSTAPGSRPG